MNIDQSVLAGAILESTSSVFVTMMESDVKPLDSRHECKEPNGGVVALVGLTGLWRGTASISCSSSTAGKMASRMLMTELPESDASISDEIMDAVGELTNMVVGNIKNSLEGVIGPMAISIPTVIFGRNFQFKSLAGHSDLRLPFTWETERIDVRVSMSPAPDRQPTVQGRVNQLMAA